MPWVSTCNIVYTLSYCFLCLCVVCFSFERQASLKNKCTNALELTKRHVAQDTDGIFHSINVYVSTFMKNKLKWRKISVISNDFSLFTDCFFIVEY